MRTENAILMQQARESLKGKWGLAIGTTVIYLLIFGGFGIIPYFAGSIVTIIIGGPLVLGFVTFFLAISRGQNATLSQLFEGFNHFGKAIGAYLLVIIFTILWLLLLIVPGIIKSISYSMTFFIIADDKSIDIMEAINKSQKMMAGYKWKFFCLGLRFIGWFLLCILTLGIGLLWLFPYVYTSITKFYEDVKANYEINLSNNIN